ncbi:hypothetical protein JCM10207_009243 [Rhodosporidiobolus poonsookiae]
MSCCCATPEQAVLGAGITLLVIYVPSSFFGFYSLGFNSEDLTSVGLTWLSSLTAVTTVVTAILALFGRHRRGSTLLSVAFWLSAILSLGAIVWSLAIEVGEADTARSKVLMAGLIIMLSALLIITPISWLAYELFKLRRHVLSTGGVTPFSGAGRTLVPQQDMQMQMQQAGAQFSDGELSDPVMMPHSLARPYGRSRRGSRSGGSSKGGYARASRNDEEAAWSAGSLLSSDEEEQHQARKARKASMKRY